MKDMTSREILDAFARGLEEATRPFYAKKLTSPIEQPGHGRASGMSEEVATFDARS